MSGEAYNVGFVQDGNTKLIANFIAGIVREDLFQIIENNKYPDGHIGY